MSLPIIREYKAPIRVKQTTLNKFYSFLPEPEEHSLVKELEEREDFSADDDYSIRLERDGTVEIEETHCLTCGYRLSLNGYNEKTAVLDNGLGEHELRLHRKVCEKCGEINPNYSNLFSEGSKYHPNLKRKARQHHMEGLMPDQIRKVLKTDFNVEIPRTTIVGWVNEAAEPLRELLEETPVPSSGYWGYDEIYLNVAGERMYAIDSVDVNTRFILAARVFDSKGKSAGRELLREARRNATLDIHGLVKDGTNNLGSLFKTRGFKNIELQTCHTHLKWSISGRVKAFAGLSRQSTKPVPKEWSWLLRRFYKVINAKDETDAYINLEIVKNTVKRLKGEKIAELKAAVRTLEAKLPKIIAHQKNPDFPRTNNILEGYQKKFEYYPAFKTQMMTKEGAQRVLDYRTFGHNFERFPEYIAEYEEKYRRWRELIREGEVSDFLKGQGNHFRWKFIKLERWYKKYKALWNKYFKKI